MSDNKQLTKENVKEFFNGVDFEYFIAFVSSDDTEIVHMAGFNNPPTVPDVLDAIEGLKTDDEYGLKKDIVDSLIVRIFSF